MALHTTQPLQASKCTGLKGEARAPGDKSISHRALILASQAIGQTTITGLLESEDVLNTAKALQACHVPIEKTAEGWRVHGVGTGGLSEPDTDLDLGNSGTGVRLLMGLMASHPFSTTFTGDESLQKRPMQRVMLPLEKMGANVDAELEGRLPLTLNGHSDMVPITYELPVASAQVKSAILLAALNIAGKTTVIEPQPTRDHTERMLAYLGAEIVREENTIALNGQPELTAKDMTVPGDPSSAAFLIVAALITPGSQITVQNVCMNPLRIGLYTTLEEMGANIQYIYKQDEAGEKIADIVASYSQLRGVNIPAERAPSMIDEYPIVSIAAAVAEGVTVMEGLKELRVKESDRLAAIEAGLKASGVQVSVTEDSLTIQGCEGAVPGGSMIQTHMDHRIAMAFLILGLASENPITVDDGAMIATSFPGFVEMMGDVGATIKRA